MKHHPCEKCGTRHRPSRHHILPKLWWRGYGGICHLCTHHHREIEALIQAEETKHSGTKSRRFKLHESEYREILRCFLGSDSSD